jgi:transposase InsO family protein
LEVRIVQMRQDHPRWGARRIRAELTRAGIDPPVVSTIHQVLVRNGLVAVRPPRQGRADKRFEREIANDLWQIDATRIVAADETEVWVVDVIDDHSRFLLAAIAGPAATGDLAWDAFEIAASRYGLPRQVLSDNGLIFTGRLHGTEVAFEVSLKELGVELINSAPYHPQTLGKLERFHRTVKEWLHDEGPPETLEHLQELLDGFRFHYNRRRPHQGIDDATPAGTLRRHPHRPRRHRVSGSLRHDRTGVSARRLHPHSRCHRQHRMARQTRPRRDALRPSTRPDHRSRPARPHLPR